MCAWTASAEACLLLLILRDSHSCWARSASFIVHLARILRELASKKFLCQVLLALPTTWQPASLMRICVFVWIGRFGINIDDILV